jgi:hypothetical protein
MNHRRHAIGVDGGKRRKIAGPVAHDPERPPYGFLTAGNAVEIAHGVERRSLPLWHGKGCPRHVLSSRVKTDVAEHFPDGAKELVKIIIVDL